MKQASSLNRIISKSGHPYCSPPPPDDEERKGEVVRVNDFPERFGGFEGRRVRVNGSGADNLKEEAIRNLMKKLRIQGKTDDVEKAMRIYFAIKVLNSMKRAEQRYMLVDTVLNLPPEEVFFWAWKLSSTKNGAYAFGVLYGFGLTGKI